MAKRIKIYFPDGKDQIEIPDDKLDKYLAEFKIFLRLDGSEYLDASSYAALTINSVSHLWPKLENKETIVDAGQLFAIDHVIILEINCCVRFDSIALAFAGPGMNDWKSELHLGADACRMLLFNPCVDNKNKTSVMNSSGVL